VGFIILAAIKIGLLVTGITLYRRAGYDAAARKKASLAAEAYVVFLETGKK